jgi:SPP1 gp7 family putative phage head morphogenesis protein
MPFTPTALPVPVGFVKAADPPPPTPEQQEEFEELIRGVLVRMSIPLEQPAVRRRIGELIRDGKLAALMVDDVWGEGWGEVERKVEAIVGDVLVQAGAAELARMNANLSFNLENPYAGKYAREQVATLVTNVTEGTKAAIREVVSRGFAQGIDENGKTKNLTTDEIARAIRPYIGLNRPQARAYAALEARLIASGVSGQDLVDQLAVAHARMIRQRAKLIARTEVMTAQNKGHTAAWETAKDEGLLLDTTERLWISSPSSPRTCPACMRMHGKRAKVGEPFISEDFGEVMEPPLHPACRCTVGLWTPEPDEPGWFEDGNTDPGFAAEPPVEPLPKDELDKLPPPPKKPRDLERAPAAPTGREAFTGTLPTGSDEPLPEPPAGPIPPPTSPPPAPPPVEPPPPAPPPAPPPTAPKPPPPIDRGPHGVTPLAPTLKPKPPPKPKKPPKVDPVDELADTDDRKVPAHLHGRLTAEGYNPDTETLGSLASVLREIEANLKDPTFDVDDGTKEAMRGGAKKLRELLADALSGKGGPLVYATPPPKAVEAGKRVQAVLADMRPGVPLERGKFQARGIPASNGSVGGDHHPYSGNIRLNSRYGEALDDYLAAGAQPPVPEKVAKAVEIIVHEHLHALGEWKKPTDPNGEFAAAKEEFEAAKKARDYVAANAALTKANAIARRLNQEPTSAAYSEEWGRVLEEGAVELTAVRTFREVAKRIGLPDIPPMVGPVRTYIAGFPAAAHAYPAEVSAVERLCRLAAGKTGLGPIDDAGPKAGVVLEKLLHEWKPTSRPAFLAAEIAEAFEKPGDPFELRIAKQGVIEHAIRRHTARAGSTNMVDAIAEARSVADVNALARSWNIPEWAP